MKISELIEFLEGVKAEKGDKNVLVDWGSDISPLEKDHPRTFELNGDIVLILYG